MDVLICDLGWQRIPVLQRYLCFETVNLLHKEAGMQIVQCLAKLSSFAFAGFYRAICAPTQLLSAQLPTYLQHHLKPGQHFVFLFVFTFVFVFYNVCLCIGSCLLPARVSRDDLREGRFCGRHIVHRNALNWYLSVRWVERNGLACNSEQCPTVQRERLHSGKNRLGIFSVINLQSGVLMVSFRFKI